MMRLRSRRGSHAAVVSLPPPFSWGTLAARHRLGSVGGKSSMAKAEVQSLGAIPFNRQFYVFKPPRPLAEIDAELRSSPTVSWR